MRAGLAERPPWLVRLYGANPEGGPPVVVGGGFLLGRDHVLTCAHVISRILLGRDGPVEVDAVAGRRVLLDFPHLPGGPFEAEVLADGWVPADEDSGDVAVLRVRAEELPGGVVPAPLRRPQALAGHRFAVLGFPKGAGGVIATGVLRGRRGAHGRWVQMEDIKTEGAAVSEGFSGCPVWDADLQAVVGIVVSKYLDEQAKTASMIPVEELERVWRPVSGWVRWRLDLDPQAETHWLPLARGVPVGESDGWFFTGRHRLLSELSHWLRQPPSADRAVRVITGRAGSGKSAVLARLVVLADPVLGPVVPLSEADRAAAPPLRAVDVAVHSRDKDIDQVVAEIAAAAEVTAATASELLAALGGRDRPFTILVDALEEAALGEDRRIARLLADLAALRSGQLRIAVAIRSESRTETGEPLAELFEPRALLLDVDSPEYLDHGDLVAYAQARLRDASAGDHPYRLDERLVAEVAEAVARRAHPLFLVAQLTCQALILDPRPINTRLPDWDQHLPSDARRALDQYMERFADRFGPAGERAVRELFTALAYAEGDGLEAAELWADLATALSRRRTGYHTGDLQDVLQSAASFLLEDHTRTDEPRYQLFHREFVDYFRVGRPERDAQRAICDTLLRRLPRWADGTPDWASADAYTLQHLATHAAAAGWLAPLLDDLAYLCAAEPSPLFVALGRERPLPPAGRVYQHVRHHLDGSQREERAAYLGLAARMLGHDPIADRLERLPFPRPWSVRWARSRRVPAHLIIGRHRHWVNAVAVTAVKDRMIAVTGGEDGSLGRWDLDEARPFGASLGAGWGSVYAVAVAALGSRKVAVTGGEDGLVRVWDLASGRLLDSPSEPCSGSIYAVAVAVLGELTVAVTGSTDGAVRVWDLVGARLVGAPLEGHVGPVCAVACAEVGGQVVAVTGGDDGSVRTWGLQGARTRSLVGAFAEPVRSLAVGPPGRALAVTGGEDGLVRVWDLHERTAVGTPLEGHFGPVYGVTVATVGSRTVAVTGGEDTSVRVWDLTEGGQPVTSDQSGGDQVNAVAVGTVGARLVAVTGGEDGSVRVWDLEDGDHVGSPMGGLASPVRAVAVSAVGTRAVAVTGGDDGLVRVWDLADGTPFCAPLEGHSDAVRAVAVGAVGDRAVAVTGSADRTVRLWDLADGTPVGLPHRHADPVGAVAVGAFDGRLVAVSGSDDGSLRIWDPAEDHRAGTRLDDQTSSVSAAAAIDLDGRLLAVTASVDGVVTVWDVANRAAVVAVRLDVPVSALALAPTGAIIVGHDRGQLRLDVASLWLRAPALGVTDLDVDRQGL